MNAYKFANLPGAMDEKFCTPIFIFFVFVFLLFPLLHVSNEDELF